MSSEDIKIELQELKSSQQGTSKPQSDSSRSKAENIDTKSTASDDESTPSGVNAKKICLFATLGVLLLISAVFAAYFFKSTQNVSEIQTTTLHEVLETTESSSNLDYDDGPSILHSNDEYDDEDDDENSNFCEKLLKITLDENPSKMICFVARQQTYSEASSMCTHHFMTPLNITAGIKEKVFDFLSSNYGVETFWILQKDLKSCQVVKSQALIIANDYCEAKHFVLCSFEHFKVQKYLRN